jgi:GNAT superfamily N-acetyltransferase
MRKARQNDVADILLLLADDDLQKLTPAPPTAQHLAAFARIDGDANQMLVIAERAGRAVGFVQLTFIPGLARNGMERCLVEGVRIARALRGQGAGRQLLDHAIGLCRARGCGLVQLMMDKRRADAGRFYEGLGFQRNHDGFRLYLTSSGG